MAFKMNGWSAFTKNTAASKESGLNERQENKLNKLISKRKSVSKDSREYATIQNKINKLKEKEKGLKKGTYKRHSKKGKKRDKNIPRERLKLKQVEKRFTEPEIVSEGESKGTYPLPEWYKEKLRKEGHKVN